jgi:hypothetical protein
MAMSTENKKRKVENRGKTPRSQEEYWKGSCGEQQTGEINTGPQESENCFWRAGLQPGRKDAR